MRTISAIRIAAALAVILLGAPRAVAAQPAPAAAAEVKIDQFAFVPQRITVKAGTPPPGFAEEILSRIRSRENNFTWIRAEENPGVANDTAE